VGECCGIEKKIWLFLDAGLGGGGGGGVCLKKGTFLTMCCLLEGRMEEQLWTCFGR